MEELHAFLRRLARAKPGETVTARHYKGAHASIDGPEATLLWLAREGLVSHARVMGGASIVTRGGARYTDFVIVGGKAGRFV